MCETPIVEYAALDISSTALRGHKKPGAEVRRCPIHPRLGAAISYHPFQLPNNNGTATVHVLASVRVTPCPIQTTTVSSLNQRGMQHTFGHKGVSYFFREKIKCSTCHDRETSPAAEANGSYVSGPDPTKDDDTKGFHHVETTVEKNMQNSHVRWMHPS